ncbi:ThuA domain-containing protein [Cellulophaga sp. F20128]|uniref:ThuA domain-containing protein n=1 Tax=Cellulophaga sp. F20128 TaxID=2926413 RepID=UPI001FF4E420|nr:ThuA domain-containing protein [Cellulophaga sp. F20128]MCK0157292.1 ThuA domain-containing protein [Cellulophaga sp. F20128]
MNNHSFKKLFLIALFLCCNILVLQAQIKNASFEKDKVTGENEVVKKLNGWTITRGNVELITNNVFSAVEGNQVLDLNGSEPGSIKQTIKGLQKSTDYTLKFEYADQKGRKRDTETLLATANIIINGKTVTTLRNLSPAPNYIGGIGFGFTSTAKGTATIEFVSTTNGNMGLVIDNLRITAGLPIKPPVNTHLVNGDFEMKVDSESGNPHIYGEQLPGWLIMRENIDLIAIKRFGTPSGKWVIDLGGHGPGGIAQTITSLSPGETYRLSMLYSRHKSWDEEDPLTGEILIDNEVVLRLNRNKSTKAPRWEKVTYDFIAPTNGEITLSLYSTAFKVGGGILYDDIKIEKVRDIVAPKKISVLIVDGLSNHQWETNTKYLQQILEATGKFNVSVSTCPNQQKNPNDWENWNPDFKKYSVVIQTYNNIFKENDLQWPVHIKRSFEKYVDEGGGVYIYHSASNAFKGWAAYNEMIGLGWRNKDSGLAVTINDKEELEIIPKGEGENSGHGPRTDPLITRIGDHPIHIGMPKTWKAADVEIYKYLRGTTKNLEVISYAKDQKTALNFPMEWTVNYGKGKVYCSTYGHFWKNQDWPPSMRCVAFQHSMVRALQWLSGTEVENFVEADFPTSESIVLKQPLLD